MQVIYDKSGSQVESVSEYEIAAATVVSEGQVVKLTAGKVVTAAVGETGAILGVAKENHPGTADTMNQRSNGTKILVSDSPTAICESKAPRLTATGGTATTIVVNDATLATYADDDFNGGKAKLVSKAVASTNTDPVGTVYSISDFVAATKTFTINAAGGAVTVGDVFEIFPPIGFQKGNLDANISKYDLSSTAALPIKTVGFDTERGYVKTEAALHQFGNKQS